MSDLKNKSISILIVEDNPLDTLIVKTLLQPHFTIKTVSNGYDALNIIEEINFNIILMDINLGNSELNGFDVMKIIKKNPKHKHINIFAVTVYSEDDELFIKEGFDALFIKPVIKEEIFDFIKKNVPRVTF